MESSKKKTRARKSRVPAAKSKRAAGEISGAEKLARDLAALHFVQEPATDRGAAQPELQQFVTKTTDE